MGWQIDVPVEPAEQEEVHPAVARTMQRMTDSTPADLTGVLTFSKYNVYEIFKALWFGWESSDGGSEEESFYEDTLRKIDPSWANDEDDYDEGDVPDGFYCWSPNVLRMLPHEAFAHVAAGNPRPEEEE